MFASSNIGSAEMYKKEFGLDKGKVDLISKLPPPKIARELRSFFGHLLFIDVSLKILARILDSYLTYLLRMYFPSLVICVLRHLKN